MDARISGRSHIPKTARDRVIEIARRIVELAMIEDVERFTHS